MGKIKVIVYYLRYEKSYKGEIVWDGKNLIPSNNSDELKMVVSTPIYVVMDSGGLGIIDPLVDPEQFIRRLNLQYRSYMLRVSEVIE
jgi:hypothetical protein